MTVLERPTVLSSCALLENGGEGQLRGVRIDPSDQPHNCNQKQVAGKEWHSKNIVSI